MCKGQILPIVHVEAENLPDAWERAVLETYRLGAMVKTQYDKETDPPSHDALAVIAVSNPFNEPRIHRGIPGGLLELETYRQEVVDGIHDHWINPKEGAWAYTYHDRLFSYRSPNQGIINQLALVIDKLCQAPHTRRAQAVTWQPWQDNAIDDPPCLQSLWFRIINDELVMNAHLRSNDALKAAFMNMYAFTDLQRRVAEQVSWRLGRTIRVGQYTHLANSFHIYGASEGEFQRFQDLLSKRSFEERTYRTDDEEIMAILGEARIQIKESLDEERRTGRKGL